MSLIEKLLRFRIEKLLRFREDQNANAIMSLVGLAIGILILIVVVTLVSPIGYNVESSVTVPATNAWSSQQTTAITNGSEMWSQLSPMVSTTALVAVVGVLIAVLLGSLSARRN